MGIREVSKALSFAALNESGSRTNPAKLKRMEAGEVIRNTCISPYQKDLIVHMRCEPLAFSDVKAGDPNIRLTRGVYYIIYLPAAHKSRKEGFPYVVIQDLMRFRLVCSGPSHLQHVADRIPEIGWLLKNSTYNKRLFSIAKEHPGMPMPFCLNIVEYADMIQDKAVKSGKDIDHKPYVCRICSFNDFEKKYTKYRVQKRTDVPERYYKIRDEEIAKRMR